MTRFWGNDMRQAFWKVLAKKCAVIGLLAIGVALPKGAAAQDIGMDPIVNRLNALEAQVNQLSLAPAVVFGSEAEPACEPCEDYFCPGWEAAAEMVYFKPRQRGLDYAVTEDGTTAVFGNAQVHSLDYDRNAGARAAVGYRTKTGWALRGTYTSFETNGTAGVDRPAGIGQLFPTRSVPDGFVETDSARASAQFEFHTFDLTADRPVYQNSFTMLSIFGGARWVDVDQLYRFDYNGRDFTNGRIIDETKMNGFGLRLGSEGRWKMAGGFSAFGSLAGGLTYGRFRTTNFEDNLDSTIVVSNLSTQYDQAIATLETRAGVSATWRNVIVSAGYELNDWFGLAERSVFTGNTERGGLATISDDILLEGFFLQVAMGW